MNFYLITSLFAALLLFTLGVRMMLDPGSPGSLLRYRTAASRRNEDTWNFANVTAGKYLMIFSLLVIFIITLTESLLHQHPTRAYTILSISFCLIIILTVYFTERKLRQIFFKDGKRKPNTF